jgi:hypothetical protein
MRGICPQSPVMSAAARLLGPLSGAGGTADVRSILGQPMTAQSLNDALAPSMVLVSKAHPTGWARVPPTLVEGGSS